MFMYIDEIIVLMLNFDGFFFYFLVSLFIYLLVMFISIVIFVVIMMEVFFGIFFLIVSIMGRLGIELFSDLVIVAIFCLFVCLYS